MSTKRARTSISQDIPAWERPEVVKAFVARGDEALKPFVDQALVAKMGPQWKEIQREWDVTYLEHTHAHERDTHIRFEEETHRYTFVDAKGNTELFPRPSSTGFIHEYFEEFDAKSVVAKVLSKPTSQLADKYLTHDGKRALTKDEVLCKWALNGYVAREFGTEVHRMVEAACNAHAKGVQPDRLSLYVDAKGKLIPEAQMFLDWLQCATDSGYRHYRTEWSIFSDTLPGQSIDPT